MDLSKKPHSELKDSLVYIRGLIIDSLREVNPWHNIKIMHTNVAQDIMSGLVVAVVALPLALAFGVGSGLGAVTGLWGAIAGGIIGGIFGGSRVGVSGPTGPKMVQLAAIMIGFRLASGEPDLTAAFSIIFISGIILVGLSFIKISRLIYYTPYSVVAGFMCGIGVIVMLLEFDSFLGLPAPHSIFEAITDIPRALTHANPQALLVSVPTLLVLFYWPKVGKWSPMLKRIPTPLVALFVGTGIAYGFAFDIEYIGAIPTGLPELYLPDFSRMGDFFFPALSLAGLAVFDSLLTCVVADHMIGEKHSSDRETFGQGLANMTAGLIGGLTTATATMRTVANIQSGGKTPLASVVHGLVLMFLVLGLGFLAEIIPMACLAAILFKVGIDILDYRILPVLHRLPVTDMIVFWVVLIVTIVEDLLIAMGVGVVLAFFRFVQEVSRVYKHQVVYLDSVKNELISDNLKNRIKVLKPQGPLFFGSIEPLEETYQKAKTHDVLVIDLKGVTMVDLSGAYALEDLIVKAQKEDKEVFVCNASPEVDNVLRRIKIIDNIGSRNYFSVEDDAMVMAQEMELVKITERQIADQTGKRLSGISGREVLMGATDYAHRVSINPQEASVYAEDGNRHKAFSKAAEDFLLGPEILDIDVTKMNTKTRVISCKVQDNFKVARVCVSIKNKAGELIESGEAVQDSEISWHFESTQNGNGVQPGNRIVIDAYDLPGNHASREVSMA